MKIGSNINFEVIVQPNIKIVTSDRQIIL